MVPVQYLNFYIFALMAVIATMLGGVVYFYNGLTETSFLVSQYMGHATFYIDKNKYELCLKGLIYCASFLAAALLLVAVIVVPTQQQIQQRLATATPFGVPAMQMRTMAAAPQPMPVAPQPMQPPPLQMQPPPMAQPAPAAPAPKAKAAPVPEPEEEILDDIEEPAEDSQTEDAGDANVVYGTGRITEEAIVEFIHRHPDSAVKFLFRRTLEGKPIPSAEEEVYRNWQKRGLSRTKVREYILQIMEWNSLPDLPLHDIWSQLRDQIFELTH